MNHTIFILLLIIHFIFSLYYLLSSKNNLVLTLSGYNFTNGLYLLIILISFLIAFRPTNLVPDSLAYYDRYFLPETSNITFQDIIMFANPLKNKQYRVYGYEMAYLLSLTYYVSYKILFPYEFFVFITCFFENLIAIIYSKKIFQYLNIQYNEKIFFFFWLFTFCYFYQLIAFAEGFAMFLLMPIMYFIIKHRYLIANILIIIALGFHISAIYCFFIESIFLFLPVFRKRTYIILWTLNSLLLCLNLGYMLGGKFGNIVFSLLTSFYGMLKLYVMYADIQTAFVSLEHVVMSILLGFFIFSSCEQKEYWKLINVILMSSILRALFGFFSILPRLTGFADTLLSIIAVIYVTKAKSFFNFHGNDISRICFAVFGVLKFISSMRIIIT